MERVWLAMGMLISTEHGETMAGYGKLIDRAWRDYGWLWKAYPQSMERLWLAMESLSTEHEEALALSSQTTHDPL